MIIIICLTGTQPGVDADIFRIKFFHSLKKFRQEKLLPCFLRAQNNMDETGLLFKMKEK